VSASQPKRVMPIAGWNPRLAAQCPETVRILRNAAFTVHPRVTAITLHGSRSLAGDITSYSFLQQVIERGQFEPLRGDRAILGSTANRPTRANRVADPVRWSIQTPYQSWSARSRRRIRVAPNQTTIKVVIIAYVPVHRIGPARSGCPPGP
jgi:hypothetical protein